MNRFFFALFLLVSSDVVWAQAPVPTPTPLPKLDGISQVTPMAAILQWVSHSNEARYRVLVTDDATARPVIEYENFQFTCVKVPLVPETAYRWQVDALNPQGQVVASGGPYALTTPGITVREVTDPKVIYAGAHAEARFVNMPPVPADPNAAISPWFDKKVFDHPAPPKFEEARAKLPRPVWDGHHDALDMYWYAWSVLFDVWVYAPPQGAPHHRAVSNMLGFPQWAGWGSTMVWDSAFILQFTRYGNVAWPVITSLDNCYARQHANGFICRESDNLNYEVYSGNPVNPPLLAWAEWSNYQLSGDRQRLSDVLLPLVKQFEWYMLNQRRENGLFNGNRSAEGMDDSPSANLLHYSIGAQATMALSAGILADIAREAGRPDLAEWFANEHKQISAALNASFWDEEHQLYNDLGPDGKPITVTEKGGVCKHGFAFWPLIAGAATEERARRMAELAIDEKTFFMPSGVGSLTRDSDGYNPETGAYWRGSVWPPINYMVIKGLERYGLEDQAQQVADRYYNEFLKAWKAEGDVREFLTPNAPKMMGCEKFVGWGGLAPIAILIEDQLGIRASAPDKMIVWRLRQTERHGIENLVVGGKSISLVCEARADAAARARLQVASEGEFALEVIMPDGRSSKHAVKTGQQTIEVQ